MESNSGKANDELSAISLGSGTPRTIRGLCLPLKLVALPPYVLDILHLSQHRPDDISEFRAVGLVTGLEHAIGQLAAGERFPAALKDIQQRFAQGWGFPPSFGVSGFGVGLLLGRLL